MPTALILVIAAIAAYFDARWRRVPNWLVASFMLVSLGWHATGGLPPLAASAAGLALSLVVLFPLFVLRGLGAGDVKFFAALGAAVTYRVVPALLLLTAVLAAAISLALVVRAGLLAATLRRLGRILTGWLPGQGPRPALPTIDAADALLVPFTLAAAAATWILLPLTRLP